MLFPSLSFHRKHYGSHYSILHYLQETVMGGGCGAKLDPRNFGSKGVIDRDIYWVKVIAGDEETARDILRQNGIVTEVQDDVLLDAALRKRPKEDYFGK